MLRGVARLQRLVMTQGMLLRGFAPKVNFSPLGVRPAHRRLCAAGCSRRATAEHLHPWRGSINHKSLRTSAVRQDIEAHVDDAADSSQTLARNFAEALRVHDIVRPGDKVVVCVSGGVDSVALLHLIADLQEEWGLDVHVLHFDHGRREESSEERAFVMELAERLGATAHVRTPARPFADANFQASARTWRRSEAQELLSRVGAHVILQGHHADDQTETVLLKLVRGCHLSNVAGMKHREGPFGRPLLDFTKAQLREFVEARGEEWREDASNADGAYLRNRIRHELVPLLQELTHGSLEARLDVVTAQSAHLREWLDTHPSSVVSESLGTSAGKFEESDTEFRELDFDVWSKLPTVAQEDQLYDYVLRTTGRQLQYRNLRKICDGMLEADVEWEWRVDKEWYLTRKGSRAWTRRKTTEQDEVAAERTFDADRGVSVSHPAGWRVRAMWEDNEDSLDHGDGFRLANLPEKCALMLRFRRPGDRFQPPTRQKAILLKDWMRGNGVPLHARDRTPLVCLDDEVIAVYPVCVSAHAVASRGGDDARRGAVLRIVVERVPR